MPASGVIFNGIYIKTLKGLLNLNDTAYILQGTVDPTSSAQNAPQGSIYFRTGGSGGTAYLKQDAGSSTNWSLISVGGAGTVGAWTDISGAGVTFQGFGTVSNTSLWARTMGSDSVEIRGHVTVGTPTATSAAIVFNGFYTIDDTLYANLTDKEMLGSGTKQTNGTTAVDSGDINDIFYDGSDTDKVFVTDAVSGNAYAKKNADAIFASGQGFTFRFEVAIT